MAPKKPKTQDADVIVVGGGPAGMSLAALLAGSGVSAICLDRDDPKPALGAGFDGRTTAISFGSRRVIEAAGAWDALEAGACPIRDIQIMDSESPALLEFLSEEMEGRSFGWIVENRHLRQALHDRLGSLKNARHIAPARVVDFALEHDSVCARLEDGAVLRAALIIGADGRESFTREWMGIPARRWSYKQAALACTAAHDNPHDNLAIEHFRPEGPFAILPMSDAPDGTHRSSVVWTGHGGHEALTYDEETFNAALRARFPERYGDVRLIGKRFSFPLSFVHAYSYVGPRMALVAEAAHGIHPIAGQGLNMGLRDIAAIAELIVAAKDNGQDIGSDALLSAYQRARRPDNVAMAAATDALNRLFSNDIGPVGLARRIGLRMVARANPVKRFFMRQAMGAGGHLPRLIRDGKLR